MYIDVQLLAENKGLQSLHDHHVKQTNLEIAELRAHLRMLVHEVSDRYLHEHPHRGRENFVREQVVMQP